MAYDNNQPSQSNNDNNQNQGGYVGEIEASVGLSDFLNPSDFLNNFGSATSSATSGISGSVFGTHSSTINNKSGLLANVGLGKLVVFAGLTFAGYWLYKKMKRR